MSQARFGDGLGVGADLLAAVAGACEQALSPLGGQVPDLVCVFASSPDLELLDRVGPEVHRLTGARHLLGCSASGVVGGGREVEGEPAVAVWAAHLPGVSLRAFHLEVLRTPEGMAVVGMPERTDQQVALLLPDAYSFPADGFVARSAEALPGLAVVGGLAVGEQGPGSTRLYLDDRVVDRGAVGVLLGGAVSAQTVVSQGCRPVGPAMTVTAASGNAILELAGTQALAKLQEILAGLSPLDQALASRGLQIGIAMDEYADVHDRGDFLVRGVLGAEDTRGSVVVGEVVDVGRTVRFQVRDGETADEDLRALLASARELRGDAAGALLFTCTGRGRQLFGSPDHDVTAVQDLLGATGVAGFFAGGELGPVGGRNHLHGFTASLLAFG